MYARMCLCASLCEGERERESTKEIFHVQSFMAVGERQQIVGYIKYLWRFGVSAKPFSFRGKKGDRAAELFSSVIYVRL